MKHRLVILCSVLLGQLFFSCTEESSVNLPPTPEFSPSQNSVRMGETVVFTNTSEEAERYIWNFGDGTPQLEVTDKFAVVQHTFNSVGNFHVYLTSVSSSGEEVSSSSVVRVGVLEFENAVLNAFPLTDTTMTEGIVTVLPWDEGGHPDLILQLLKPNLEFLASDLQVDVLEGDLPLQIPLNGLEASGFWVASEPFIITAFEEDTLQSVGDVQSTDSLAWDFINASIVVENPLNELQRSIENPLNFTGVFQSENNDLQVSLNTNLYLFSDTIYLQQNARKQDVLKLPERIKEQLDELSI